MIVNVGHQFRKILVLTSSVTMYRRFLESSVRDLKSSLLYKSVAGETIGVLFLVFVACSSPYLLYNDHGLLRATLANATDSSSWDRNDADHTRISLSFGLSVATMVWVLGCISGGHINPAVTLAMFIMRKVSLARFVLYLIAQCVGAVIGAALVKAITCRWQIAKLGECGLGLTKIDSNVTTGEGFAVELLITFVLVITVFATCDPSKFDHKGSGPLAIGLSVTMCHLSFIKLTGASMNPARTFGPAVILGDYEHHWVYWVAPLLGGILAGAFYEFILAGDASLGKIKQWAVSPDYGLVGADDEEMDAISQTSAEPPADKDQMARRRSSQWMVPMTV